MDEQTPAMTEVVTLFAPGEGAGGAVAAARRHIDELAARLGLGRDRLSALHAVMAWAGDAEWCLGNPVLVLPRS